MLPPYPGTVAVLTSGPYLTILFVVNAGYGTSTDEKNVRFRWLQPLMMGRTRRFSVRSLRFANLLLVVHLTSRRGHIEGQQHLLHYRRDRGDHRCTKGTWPVLRRESRQSKFHGCAAVPRGGRSLGTA